MTQRSIRRAQQRKTRKEQQRRARNQTDPRDSHAKHIPIAAKEEFSALCERVAEAEPCRHGLEFEHDYAPPLSAAKLQANRANAQLSTGPKSCEGKDTSSHNAVKTALTGRTILLPGDDPAEYDRHVQAFFTDNSPVGPRESDLVQSMADTWWRLKRIPCLESSLFAQGQIDFAEAFGPHDPSIRPRLIQAQTLIKYERQIRNLQIQEARLFRRYEKDRAELRQLQQQRHDLNIEALKAAAVRYQEAKEANQPFNPADFGFEFSIAQLEQQLERTRAHEARISALLAAQFPPSASRRAQAQAA